MANYKAKQPQRGETNNVPAQAFRSQKHSEENLEGICILSHIEKPLTIYIEQGGLYILEKEGIHIVIEKDGSIPYEPAPHIMRASNYVWHNCDTNKRLERITPHTIGKIKRARNNGRAMIKEMDIFRKEEDLFELHKEKMYLNLSIDVALQLLEKKYEFLNRGKEGIDFQTNQRYY